MSFEVVSEVIENYAYVRVSGRYHHQQAKQAFYQVLDLCYKNSLIRILVDYREQQGHPNLIQKMDYLLYITSAIRDLFPRESGKIRVVYLGPSLDNDPRDRSRMLIEQSGVKVWSSTTLEQAVEWLQQEK